jgi:hypothetical protein
MPKTIDAIKVETREIKWLAEKFRNDLLHVDDTFQRRYVWTKPNQISLIETILLGYPIPEIYLWTRQTNPDTGDTRLSIVDGQQRLGAVFKFLNGEYKLTLSGLEFKDADYKGKNFAGLTEDQRSAIWKYPFSVRFVSEDIPREEIVKMFLRLNSSNMSLNPQELRNAEFNGKFIQLAADIADNPFWKIHKLFNQLDLRRMLDVQFVSSILIFFRLGINEETDQSTLNRVYDLYNEAYDEADQDRALFEQLLIDADVIIDANQNVEEFLRKKTHLYTLLIVLYHFRTHHTQIGPQYAMAYREFVNLYGADVLDDLEFGPSINEYKVLSNEGVQKRANRLRRFEIVRDFLQVRAAQPALQFEQAAPPD